MKSKSTKEPVAINTPLKKVAISSHEDKDEQVKNHRANNSTTAIAAKKINNNN